MDTPPRMMDGLQNPYGKPQRKSGLYRFQELLSIPITFSLIFKNFALQSIFLSPA
ncbi:Uncharacterised protein [Moraxella caprae]|uniref:Uncharacterized protein n=1 Tax=Moraxella caprae TaxID=90240 RepID=A0A378QYC9_9GAMM|nr:Uncharacterised protein [Moraxella caprae]